ncbi:MAG: PspC domain-containing protein [Bacteroidetes bacterium]|nr:PspC domain-containing protein [Bacteroidota bacterium]
MIDKYRIKALLETNAYGVCRSLGDKLGIATSKIRLFFVYISFLGLGSPIVLYLILAFVKDLRRYIRTKRRNPVWDF